MFGWSLSRARPSPYSDNDLGPKNPKAVEGEGTYGVSASPHLYFYRKF